VSLCVKSKPWDSCGEYPLATPNTALENTKVIIQHTGETSKCLDRHSSPSLLVVLAWREKEDEEVPVCSCTCIYNLFNVFKFIESCVKIPNVHVVPENCSGITMHHFSLDILVLSIIPYVLVLA
jgi:hypothetical protein